MALAHDVARRSLRGASVLELGCGLGLPSIAAALAGGRVLATDWSADAVRADGGQRARSTRLRSRPRGSPGAAPEAIVERAPWRYVIASDVLYEPRNVDLLLELLPRLVDKTGPRADRRPGPQPGGATSSSERPRALARAHDVARATREPSARLRWLERSHRLRPPLTLSA